MCSASLDFGVFVKGGVDAVVVFAVEMAADLAEGFTEALEMVDFPLAEELDGVSHVGIADQPQ